MAANARQPAGIAVIAGTLPYLTLKGLWLTGNPVGLTDPAFADDPSMRMLNIATAGMEVIAVALALAMSQSWGQRLPAWLVLFPVWIGTGFLAPIVLAAPLIATEADPGKLPLEPWVQPLVYGGFAWQGVALLVAFALYVRARWPRFGSARCTAKAGMPWVGVVLGLFAAVTSLSQGRVIDGILALAGVVGVSAIVGRWRVGGRVWPPAVAGWIGTGAMVAWGAWGLVNVLGNTILVTGFDLVGTAADVAKVLGAALLVYGVTRSPDLRITRYASASALP